jgi:hypothetical protein
MAIMGTRAEEPNGSLREHYGEIVRDYGLLFERKSARPPAQWPASIEYRMTGGVAYYYNEKKTVILPLAFPKTLEGVEEQVRSHLGPENWERWEGLVRDTNAHLELVTKMWIQILEDLAAAAREIGLREYEKLIERPVDIYWPSKFLEAIWGDIGFYDKNHSHQWETVEIVEEMYAMPMRHNVDTVQTWVFSGLPWVMTQSKDAAEKIKKVWEDEAVKVEPGVWDLLQERSRIESRTVELLSTLRRSELEYAGYRRNFPYACSVCRPWLDELKGTRSSALTV